MIDDPTSTTDPIDGLVVAPGVEPGVTSGVVPASMPEPDPEAADDERGWYVLRCTLRAETPIADELRRNGLDAFLPRCTVRRRIPGGLRKVAEPLFPGYVFVRLSPSRGDLSVVRSIRGVHGVLRFGDFAPRVPDETVERIGRVDGLELDRPGGRPQDGDLARMTVGRPIGLQTLFVQREGPARSTLLCDYLRGLCRDGAGREVVEPVW